MMVIHRWLCQPIVAAILQMLWLELLWRCVHDTGRPVSRLGDQRLSKQAAAAQPVFIAAAAGRIHPLYLGWLDSKLAILRLVEYLAGMVKAPADGLTGRVRVEHIVENAVH
jgi:hypothetical protein